MAETVPPARLYVALTSDMGEDATASAAPFLGTGAGVKVGMELFTRSGPRVVRELAGVGFPVFLDLKFHDIPFTVGGAVASACGLGATLINVHASGGRAMMEAAAEEAHRRSVAVIGVTLLTSLGPGDAEDLGWGRDTLEVTLRLAGLARESGLDGVVCSPSEAAAVRAQAGPGFLIVTPGIRPAGSDAADQKRTATPGMAVAAGADAIVVGRPVTGAEDPAAAAMAVIREMEEASARMVRP
jgi:orotidine-5'-phosphate decarboxylase